VPDSLCEIFSNFVYNSRIYLISKSILQDVNPFHSVPILQDLKLCLDGFGTERVKVLSKSNLVEFGPLNGLKQVLTVIY
jgi:hypothetical protein